MDTNSLRKYGEPPFIAAVIHGGPGACCQMAPVARELASRGGILEPLLTALSTEGQVKGLRNALEGSGNLPITLIGFSWGAWLGLVFSARYPAYVRKLILVGCAGLEDEDGQRTFETRLKRLKAGESADFKSIIADLNDPGVKFENASYKRLEELLLKTDAYNPITVKPDENQSIAFHPDVFRNVWEQGAQLRKSGELLELAKSIRCPVIAIHGDYDPHPARGVQRPLSSAIVTFRFIMLKNCGHTPWIEKRAREAFYRILEEELSGNSTRIS